MSVLKYPISDRYLGGGACDEYSLNGDSSCDGYNSVLEPLEDFVDGGSRPAHGSDNAVDVPPEPAADPPPNTVGYLPTRSEVLIYTGFILGRVSKASMLRRKWRQLIWARTEKTQLLLFRSLADYRAWNADADVADDGDRQTLVKMKIDFLEECSRPDIDGFYVTKTKLKHYDVEDDSLYQFKVDKWISSGACVGPTTVAAFASIDEHEIESIRGAILACIDAVPGETGGDYGDFSCGQHGGAGGRTPADPHRTDSFSFA
mmetsp:Transcript_1175/g.2581  ORF Transcript_1175/g.2581 Transcript_1175/m.2581 type:complete len:260 (+) Transcript_1175:106-885(+)